MISALGGLPCLMKTLKENPETNSKLKPFKFFHSLSRPYSHKSSKKNRITNVLHFGLHAAFTGLSVRTLNVVLDSCGTLQQASVCKLLEEVSESC